MENRIKTSGRLIYDPPRPGMTKLHKARTLIIELPNDDLARLYQWFIFRNVRSTRWGDDVTDTVRRPNEHETWTRPYVRRGELVTFPMPMYGLHVTLIGGNERMEKEKFAKHWRKDHGKIVEFEYAPVPRQHQIFWSLPVYAEHLQIYRQRLGLPREVDFHITIARQYPFQPVPEKNNRRATEIRLEMDAQEKRERRERYERTRQLHTELPVVCG